MGDPSDPFAKHDTRPPRMVRLEDSLEHGAMPTETPSGVYRAVTADMHEEFRNQRFWAWVRNLVIAGGTTAGGLFAGFTFLDNRVSAQTDAGVRVVAARADATQRELERHEAEEEKRHEREEASQARLETKLDKMLERFQIPNPAPAPKDGGR